MHAMAASKDIAKARGLMRVSWIPALLHDADQDSVIRGAPKLVGKKNLRGGRILDDA